MTLGAFGNGKTQGACPDCPSSKRGVFDELIARDRTSCVFSGTILEARAPMPPTWFEMHGLAIVRRGVIVRQRVDVQGRTSTIDVVGPGGAFTLEERPGEASTPSGYAASRALLCLMPTESHEGLHSNADKGTLDLLRLQTEALERVERISDARGRPSAESQMAALLCTLSDVLYPGERRESITSQLQQRDLAAVLGLRHETVSRVLRKLSERGFIERDGEDLRIANRTALEAL